MVKVLHLKVLGFISALNQAAPAMADEFGVAGQNVTGEVNDKAVAIVTWTVVSFFVFLNVVVISFQIYGQRSKLFLFFLLL